MYAPDDLALSSERDVAEGGKGGVSFMASTSLDRHNLLDSGSKKLKYLVVRL
jgi:hypothetical protein